MMPLTLARSPDPSKSSGRAAPFGVTEYHRRQMPEKIEYWLS